MERMPEEMSEKRYLRMSHREENPFESQERDDWTMLKMI
jgi:hypothetical protein